MVRDFRIQDHLSRREGDDIAQQLFREHQERNGRDFKKNNEIPSKTWDGDVPIEARSPEELLIASEEGRLEQTRTMQGDVCWDLLEK